MKFGFAGTGYINKIHAQAAITLELEWVAGVNHRPELLAEFGKCFGITRQYETVEALLKDGDTEALVNSTPSYLHAPQAIAALKAGVYVTVEAAYESSHAGKVVEVK